MKPPRDLTDSPDPRLPLLQAIQREVLERRGLLRAAEGMLAALQPTRRRHAEQVVRLRSEVSLQRRELRQVARELARLGVAFDADDPRTLVALAPAQEAAAPVLAATGFFRPPVDPGA